MTTYELIAATQTSLWNQIYTNWINNELFSFTWWFTVLFLVVSYFIWWKLLDKSRLVELLLFGSFLAVMSAILDTVANNLVLWQYTVKIFPFTPAFFPFHLTLAPITLMLVYQYTTSWSSFLLATTLASAVYSFIISPLFVAIGEVQLIKWNYGYNFITYIARAMIARWILIYCQQIQMSYQEKSKLSYKFRAFAQPAVKPLPEKDEKDNDNAN